MILLIAVFCVEIAAVDVREEIDAVADRGPDRFHDLQILVRHPGHLDLKPSDAVGDDLGRFLGRVLRRCDADAVAQLHLRARGAAEELVTGTPALLPTMSSSALSIIALV